MARSPVVTLAPGVHRIPTAPWDWVNSFALVDDDGSVTLVDAGLRFAPKRLLDGLTAIGKKPNDVTRIVMTHAHIDHAGGLARMTEETGARVAAHERDAIYLRTGRPPRRDKSIPAARLMERVPGFGFAPVAVDDELRDGSVIDVAGGLEVLHTPGHTPGHVSLLHRQSGVLITGDALFNLHGIGWSFASSCTSFPLSQQTAQRLGDADYSVAAFTHGPEIRDRAREAVRSFLRERAR